MQKLLRKSPSGPVLCTLGSTPSSLAPFHFSVHKSFLSLGSKNPTSSPSSSLSMPPAAASFAAGGGSAIAGSFSKRRASTVGSRFAAGAAASRNCCICRCSLENRAPFRAWLVSKDGRPGSRVAWLQTASDGSFSAAAVEGTKTSEKGLEGFGDDGGEAAETGSEEKPVRLHRRQRGSSNGNALTGNPDLLTIPGVGPRNLRKLVENGISGVAELKQLYKDKFFGKSSQKMVEFLQSSVGIIHRNHAESITTYIKESVDEDLEEDVSKSDAMLGQKKRLTFCVEGNISVGKTTFLQRIANETLELRDLVEVVPEPINKWQDVGPDHFNILDAFYAEPQRYAYTFQNYVFVTRVMQERESSGGIKPLRLMERSVFSDRMVFVRAVHEANWMNEMEISIYDSWFDPVVSCLPGLIPDAFIYLRASPDTCHQRMKLRKRAEEGGVSLDYLRDLHEKHESWLFPFESGNHGVLSVNKLPLHSDSSLHPDIRGRVFFLEGNHMHSSIQKVPALVLDCEPNIDFSKDIEAKRQYARQVAEFFEYVKKKKDEPTKAGEGDKTKQPQILLPPEGELWLPNKHFPGSALKSLDFRRAMSFMSG
ncbi:Deoxynucleoside kinase domain containing protein [Trema orientale]|uniref:Deoxynucleoside kinase domain containing protein n=1 Tax=Trema orientale TaxID=63057 RepID=A0A2P5DUM4_TREOI|nr:Deoxynucleoside kinase domain containing protein [Trema orientale]